MFSFILFLVENKKPILIISLRNTFSLDSVEINYLTRSGKLNLSWACTMTLPCSQPSHGFPAPSSRETSELSPGIRGPNPLSRIWQLSSLCRVLSASCELRTSLSLILLMSVPGKVLSEILRLLCPGLLNKAFIWLHQVLAVACRRLVAACGI